MKILRGLLFIGLSLTFAKCVSLKKESAPPPLIDDKITLKEAVEAALNYGGDTHKAVRKMISKRHAEEATGNMLFSIITKDIKNLQNEHVMNAVYLYQSLNHEKADEVFYSLTTSDRTFAKKLGWELAAALPSKKMAQKIDEKLTLAVKENELEESYFPEMAEAVANNELNSSYSIIRHGLFMTNDIHFARAMKRLNPKQASEDFMDYLAQAPVEELRQLNMNTLDVLTCMDILQHLLAYPAKISHPNFEHLFYFSISRNPGLAEAARQVLDGYLSQHGKQLALLLAKQQNWIQLAFIESARGRMTPLVGVFLQELGKVSAQQDVVEEIQNVKM